MTTQGIVNTSRAFVTVFNSPSLAGTMSFNLVTFDTRTWNGRPLDADLTLTVTGICATDTEEQLAKKIECQFRDQIKTAGYEYRGKPVFSSMNIPISFRVTRTDHIVCIWSQAAMELTLLEDTTESLTIVDQIPGLVTLDFAKQYAQTLDYFFENDGQPFTDEVISLLIINFSSLIIQRMGHFVAMCTFLNTFIGNDEKDIFIKPTPGYLRDPLVVRFKTRGLAAEEANLDNGGSTIPYPPNYFTFDNVNGKLHYRPDSQLVDMNSPWRRDNEVRVTIQAGFKKIPTPIKLALVQLLVIEQTGVAEFEEIAGGSFKMKQVSAELIVDRVFATIKPFKSK